MTIKRKIYDEKLIAGDLDVTVDEVFGDSDGYFIGNIPMLRVRTEDVGNAVIEVQAKMEGETAWTTIKTISGETTTLILNRGYDYVRFECTTFDTVGTLYLSSFFFESALTYDLATVDIVTDDVTLDDSYAVVLCNKATPMTVTLPPANQSLGKTFTVKNINVGTVTITPDGAETIDGAASKEIATQYTTVVLIPKDGNWYLK